MLNGRLMFDGEEVMRLRYNMQNTTNRLLNLLKRQCLETRKSIAGTETSGQVGEFWHLIPDTEARLCLQEIATEERLIYDELSKKIPMILEFMQTQTSAYIQAEEELATAVEAALKEIEDLSTTFAL